jgi:DNA-binding NarL/FixJ family response regulator
LAVLGIWGQGERHAAGDRCYPGLETAGGVLDIRMPYGSGIDVLRDIKRESLALIVIGLINYP